MRITVSTNHLRTTASDVYKRADRVEHSFQEIRRIVNDSAGYWEGEGNNAYIGAYNRRLESVERALRRFRENATDLEKMAGIYEAGEASNITNAEPLATDVII